MKVEAGQLRRWNKDAAIGSACKIFLVIESGAEPSSVFSDDLAWTYIMDGVRDWDFEEDILDDSELVSAGA